MPNFDLTFLKNIIEVFQVYNKNDSTFVYLALFLKTTSEGTAGKKGTPTSSLLTDLAVNI